MGNHMRLKDADALKEFIEGAYRPLCDDYHMKDYVLNQILTDIENEPAIDAIPIYFIEKKIESIRQYVEKRGGEIDIEEFIDGLISKAVAYERLIEEWREENGQAD